MFPINDPKYADIIDRPHHVSATRPQMPMADRAAQFSPFAALTGYADGAVTIEAAGTTYTFQKNEVAQVRLRVEF